jgi:hypothetical protein
VLPDSVTRSNPAGEIDPAISVTVSRLESVVYAPPGSSEPGPRSLLRLKVEIGAGVVPGGRDIRVVNPGWKGPVPPAGRWFLQIDSA